MHFVWRGQPTCMVILRAATYREMPWKNGGGTTRQIATASDDLSPSWRLSMAHIGRDGPFSNFCGYDRTILPIRGNGIVLSFDDLEPVTLERLGIPFSFRGEPQTLCRLIDGPVIDLNVMTRRNICSHTVEIQRPTCNSVSLTPTGICFVHALNGELTAVQKDAQEVRLAAGDTARIDGGAVRLKAVEPLTIACIVRITIL